MLNQRDLIVVKDNLAKAVIENCNIDEFEQVIEISEEVMDELDNLLFSDVGLEMTEFEIQAEVSTMIYESLKKRGLKIQKMGK